MILYILFLVPISILLSQKPPPPHATNRKYVRVNQYLISPWGKHDLVKEKFPPQLPPKRNKYVREGPHKVTKVQSNVHYKVYKVEVYHGTIRSTFYKCNHDLFPNKILADKYCESLNKYWKAKRNQGYQRQTSRNSLTRSNSDLTDRRNSISETSGFTRGRNSIPGSLNRSSKRGKSFSPEKNSSSRRSSLSKTLETLHISEDSD